MFYFHRPAANEARDATNGGAYKAYAVHYALLWASSQKKDLEKKLESN